MTALNKHRSLLSIVLPVFNEELVLPLLMSRVARAADACDMDYEVLFIDDGSTDSSGQLLDDFALSQSQVRVVHLSRNFGHQAAVLCGLHHARGDAIVLMDSDLQDAPEAIPRFVRAWKEGYEVAYAVRAKRKENFVKRCLFAAFHRLLSRAASTPIPAEAGIFGLIDRRVADEIVRLGEYDRYYPGLRSWVGFRQIGITVERLARYDEKPRVSLGGLFRLAKTALFSFSHLPLWCFYLIGAAAGTIFFALSGYALYCRLFTDTAIPGWTTHVLVGSFFGALNALGIAVLGEYVVRIHDQVRGRPHYIVARRVNYPNHDALPESNSPGDHDRNICPAAPSGREYARD